MAAFRFTSFTHFSIHNFTHVRSQSLVLSRVCSHMYGYFGVIHSRLLPFQALATHGSAYIANPLLPRLAAALLYLPSALHATWLCHVDYPGQQAALTPDGPLHAVLLRAIRALGVGLATPGAPLDGVRPEVWWGGQTRLVLGRGWGRLLCWLQ